MLESRIWRYARRDNRVPDAINFHVRLVGGKSVDECHKGCMYYRLTESHLEIVDPRGAGVVGSVERGLVRRVDIGVSERA